MLNDEDIKLNIINQTELNNTALQTMEDSDIKELEDMFSMPKKKKKKRKQNNDDTDNILCNTNYTIDYPTYDYDMMLNRIYDDLEKNHITNFKYKNTLKMPIVQRFGSKKTGWINFKEFCENINREQLHILNFVVNELSTEASIDGKSNLVIKGLYTQKNIENILKKYVILFIKCSICCGIQTTMRREKINRLYFIDCLSCKSSRALTHTNLIKNNTQENKK